MTISGESLCVAVYHGGRSDEGLVFLRRLELEMPEARIMGVLGGMEGFQSLPKAPDVVLVRHTSSEVGGAPIRGIVEQTLGSVVIVVADYATPKEIVEAMTEGAHDFILTPDRKLLGLQDKVLNAYRIAYERMMPTAADAESCPEADIYVGGTIEVIKRSVPRIISSAISTIYINGDTGTGKEVVAELFRLMLGTDVPFIKVNCGAITPSLMESEFFGYAKGAFTGANNAKIGLVEHANGGWLFLDEVANLTKEAQAALLRVIENQVVIPVGETVPRPIQVRFLSATNENIEELVDRGLFRMDLWQRLSEKVVYLPPLAQRRDEIPYLVDSIAKNMLGGPYQVSPAAMHILCEASWSEGNIRQLRNCLRAMTEFSVNRFLTPQCIPREVLTSMVAGATSSAVIPEVASNMVTIEWQEGQPSFDDLADQLLIKLIRQRSEDHDKLSLRKLASSMGMVRNTLSNRMKVLARKKLLLEPDILELIGEST